MPVSTGYLADSQTIFDAIPDATADEVARARTYLERIGAVDIAPLLGLETP